MGIVAWLARPRVLAVLAVATLACVAGFQLPASPAASVHFTALTGTLPFDERVIGYTLSEVLQAFARLGDAGLPHYIAYRLLDLPFPWLLCGLVGAMLVRLDAAAALPLCALAAVVDTAENVALAAVLLTRADLSPHLVPWASGLTQLKFAAYSLMLIGLIVAGLRRLWLQRQWSA